LVFKNKFKANTWTNDYGDLVHIRRQVVNSSVGDQYASIFPLNLSSNYGYRCYYGITLVLNNDLSDPFEYEPLNFQFIIKRGNNVVYTAYRTGSYLYSIDNKGYYSLMLTETNIYFYNIYSYSFFIYIDQLSYNQVRSLNDSIFDFYLVKTDGSYDDGYYDGFDDGCHTAYYYGFDFINEDWGFLVSDDSSYSYELGFEDGKVDLVENGDLPEGYVLSDFCYYNDILGYGRVDAFYEIISNGVSYVNDTYLLDYDLDYNFVYDYKLGYNTGYSEGFDVGSTYYYNAHLVNNEYITPDNVSAPNGIYNYQRRFNVLADVTYYANDYNEYEVGDNLIFYYSSPLTYGSAEVTFNYIFDLGDDLGPVYDPPGNYEFTINGSYNGETVVKGGYGSITRLDNVDYVYQLNFTLEYDLDLLIDNTKYLDFNLIFTTTAFDSLSSSVYSYTLLTDYRDNESYVDVKLYFDDYVLEPYTLGYMTGRNEATKETLLQVHTNGFTPSMYPYENADSYFTSEEFLEPYLVDFNNTKYTEGYNIGYNEGLVDGYANVDGEAALLTLTGTTIGAIWNMLTSMLDVTVMGINVRSVVIGLISISLILFILKLFL